MLLTLPRYLNPPARRFAIRSIRHPLGGEGTKSVVANARIWVNFLNFRELKCARGRGDATSRYEGGIRAAMKDKRDPLFFDSDLLNQSRVRS